MKVSSYVVLLFGAASLTACSTNLLQQDRSTPTPPKHYIASPTTGSATSSLAESDMVLARAGTAGSENVAGSLERSMDEIDKSKMLHALDKSPGKSTTWVNSNTGITYTVTPVKKVEVDGNPYCREYITKATKGGRERQFGGTACVGADGSWRSV